MHTTSIKNYFSIIRNGIFNWDQVFNTWLESNSIIELRISLEYNKTRKAISNKKKGIVKIPRPPNAFIIYRRDEIKTNFAKERRLKSK
uniref:MATA-HMG n=3 Tax=Rhizophagus irregularis TaxID=588596 RepID=R9UAP8_9GLOM|nr:MATA_HMG [Rhizophagus irregularis]ANQ33083.1 MATA-HMG [Rhizophagus irregularis]